MKNIMMVLTVIFATLLIIGCKAEVDSENSPSTDQENASDSVTIDIPSDNTQDDGNADGISNAEAETDDSSDSNILPIEIEVN